MEGPGSLILAPQVAKRLNVSVRTVYVWAEKGYLPSIRFGGKALRFDPVAIDAWIQEHAQVSA
ncbi:MAG: helix-turn-helix domain-containing protein [Actinomycetota bacterium]|nr:helix-turn-helix domain-containing protein [Actinomycetota bacterium]